MSEEPPAYQGYAGEVTWTGVRVPQSLLDQLREGPLLERMHDLALRDQCIAELQAMASTDMATDVITQLLESETTVLDWEVGEAIAETLLQEQHAAVWPWNMSRDRRTPRASLPGADLVGFVREGQNSIYLLFGEVKTSTDINSPPNVIYGKGGLARQLESLSVDRKLHFTLLRWLRVRCRSDEHRDLYQQAVQKFISSGGRDFRLVGCLMRDTEPSERDLSIRGLSLSQTVVEPTRLQLLAWYLPGEASSWPSWVEVA